MPATTSQGFPYPLGTDRVMDGDNAIQSLAQYIDTTHAFGAATMNPTEGPGANATRWFGSCSAVALGGGFTATSGVGTPGYLTVPRKGYYQVQSHMQISASQNIAGNVGTIFIGDGTTPWVYGALEIPVATYNQSHAVSCMTVVQLAAGARISWGMTATGPSAVGPPFSATGPSNQLLFARLLFPLP